MLKYIISKQKSFESIGKDLFLKIKDKDLALGVKTKYIGVWVDNYLDWKEQIKSVSV